MTFAAGDLVQLTDPRRKLHTITLEPGAVFHTHRGAVRHDDIIGAPEATVVASSDGTDYLALKPILEDYVLSMGRGAAIIYPKDAASIVGLAGLRFGSRVLEAGAGSGALTLYLLSVVGPQGTVTSYEARPEFADVARRNVTKWFGHEPPNWTLVPEALPAHPVVTGADAVVLDMLEPWECLEAAWHSLAPGGRLVCYVATTTQLSMTVESVRASGRFTEPRSTESLLRTWHLEGLAVRPDHSMNGHTGFLTVCRRLGDGVTLPVRKRRPAPGAYGPSYTGPRPPDVAADAD
ncbi:MAG: tRNA (adenine-N1)-methyltransferase [Actinobacteria bacterium]|nr:tRNA (adenine-N1)-methyltransferase [Actinomycetota bacterium]